MNKIFKATTLSVALGVCGVSAATYAGDIGVKAGTLGFGLEYTHALSDKFSVSGGINRYDYSAEIDESGVKYEAELELNSFSLLGNFHPFENGFRITAGALVNNNELSGGVKSGSYTYTGNATVGGIAIRNQAYTAGPNGDVDGDLRVTFKEIAPYLGIGWSHSRTQSRKLSFLFDLGVAFQGAPELTLNGSCGTTGEDTFASFGLGNETDCQAAVDEIIATERPKVDEDLDKFKLYPVMSLGILYSF